jgi:hypothetical protein
MFVCLFVCFYVFATSGARDTGEVRTVLWWETLRGKRQLGRSMQKWEDNTKTDFQNVGKGKIAWIDLALDR